MITELNRISNMGFDPYCQFPSLRHYHHPRPISTYNISQAQVASITQPFPSYQRNSVLISLGG